MKKPRLLILIFSMTLILLSGCMIVSGIEIPPATPSPQPTKTPKPTPTPIPVEPFTHDEQIVDLQYSQDGKWLASASADGVVRIWEAATGELITQMVHTGRASSVAFSPNDSQVVSGGENGATVWDSTSGKEILRFNQSVSVDYVAFSTDGHSIVTVSSEEGLAIWEALNGRNISRIEFRGVHSASLSTDAKWVAVVDFGIVTFDITTGETYRALRQESYPEIYTAVDISPDNVWIAAGVGTTTASVPRYLYIWNAENGNRVMRQSFGFDISDIDFQPDGNLMALAGLDLVVYDRSNQQIVRKDESFGLVRSVEFSPDGNSLAVGSNMIVGPSGNRSLKYTISILELN